MQDVCGASSDLWEPGEVNCWEELEEVTRKDDKGRKVPLGSQPPPLPLQRASARCSKMGAWERRACA